MLRRSRLLLALPLLLSLSGVACGGDDEDGDTGSASDCDLIGDACHDASDPDAIACHDVGHAGDEAACTAMKADCLALCGGGSSSGGSGSDTSTSG